MQGGVFNVSNQGINQLTKVQHSSQITFTKQLNAAAVKTTLTSLWKVIMANTFSRHGATLSFI